MVVQFTGMLWVLFSGHTGSLSKILTNPYLTLILQIENTFKYSKNLQYNTIVPWRSVLPVNMGYTS